jgi:two-component system cell cycle response regulator
VHPSPSVLLIDPNDAGRAVLAERLRLQGFAVKESTDGADGAISALEAPPAAVVADLSMPSISGVQLCRLLRSEAGTSSIPVILRGAEGRRNRFWAEQAGAFAYVVKGRMAELVRALRKAFERQVPDDGFFVVSSTEGLDVRDRIATHLDAALFESVIAAEVRRLGTSESFDRLVDLLSQFVSQVTTYRWMAVLRHSPMRLGIHTNPHRRDIAVNEAVRAVGTRDATPPIATVEDEDAVDDIEGPAAVTAPIVFGDASIGVLALAPRAPAHVNDPVLVKTIARELGGALRMATLVEESRWMATTDTLTGLLNRRAFLDWGKREVARATRYKDPLSVVLLDVDHFKLINDKRGHSVGDLVLSRAGHLLSNHVRSCDVVARWGGEEFVIALPSTGLAGASLVAERIREALSREEILDRAGQSVHVTASFGVAQLGGDETLELLVDRADRAMYGAKSAGRNRVFSTNGASLKPVTATSTAGADEPTSPAAA